MAQCAIGVDIGGTKIAAGAVAEDGAVLFALQRPTPLAEGVTAVARLAAELAREAKARAAADGHSPIGVGLAVGGQVDVFRQRVVGATERFPGWESVPLKEAVEQAAGLPVVMDNDAKAVGRAELRWGSARGFRHAVFVTLGTGVGGAMAVDGRIVDGARGFAGHLGHIVVQPGGPRCLCGGAGCLEVFASASGIVRMARELVGSAVPIQDAAEVFQAAQEGAAWAEMALRQAADALGAALAGLIHALNPQVVVIGGGLSAWGEPWRQRIERATTDRVMPAFSGTFEVRLARYGPQSGVAGAGALVFDARQGGWPV